MIITETKLKGCFIIEPTVFMDSRGYVFESFNQRNFEKTLGISVRFVQDNQSFSKKGVIRALHYQKGEYAQAKLVRVLHGSVLDVVVDLRKESPTYKHHLSIELSAENKKQLFIPKGFAHGFLTLSENAEFFYKCDHFYNKAAEGGILYCDPELNINWGIASEDIILSEKDKKLSLLKDLDL